MSTDERWADGRDAAQQIVTALLHGDRTTAGDIAATWDETNPPIILSMVLADLCAYVHCRWTRAVGMSIEDGLTGWAEMMTDIEEWRAEVDK